MMGDSNSRAPAVSAQTAVAAAGPTSYAIEVDHIVKKYGDFTAVNDVSFFVKEGENPREVYGSIYPTEFAEAKAALIEARIKDLKDLVLE